MEIGFIEKKSNGIFLLMLNNLVCRWEIGHNSRIFTAIMHITLCIKLYLLPLNDDCKFSSGHDVANGIFQIRSLFLLCTGSLHIIFPRRHYKWTILNWNKISVNLILRNIYIGLLHFFTLSIIIKLHHLFCSCRYL